MTNAFYHMDRGTFLAYHLRERDGENDGQEL